MIELYVEMLRQLPGVADAEIEGRDGNIKAVILYMDNKTRVRFDSSGGLFIVITLPQDNST